jgi:hypothetical protein
MKNQKLTETQNRIFADLAMAVNRFGILLGLFAVLLLFLGITFVVGPRHAPEVETHLLATGIGVAIVALITVLLCFLLLKPADQYRKVLKKHPRVSVPIIDGLRFLVASEKFLRIILSLFLLAGLLGALSTQPGLF